MNADMQEQILRSLNAAVHSRKLYPPGHPSIAAGSRKIHQLAMEYLKEKPKLAISMVEDALIFEHAPVADSEENFPDIIFQMKGKNIEAVIIERGVSEKEVLTFLEILTQEKTLPAAELQKELGARGVKHVTLKSVPAGRRNILEVYNDAISVVKNAMDDVRLGKIPDSGAVKAITAEMTELVLADPNAMIGLTMIKNYDNYLYNHSVNVSILAVAFGDFLKFSKDDLHTLGVASLLHDIGKTGVSEDIIKKPGGLSSDEWEKVKEHPVLGSKITERMSGIDETVRRIIYEHHVRFDRSGYPYMDAPLHPLSMVVSVSDAYDALTTLRVYQKPYQPVEAVKILKGLSGKHFDPQTVNSFANMIGHYPVGTMVRLSTNEVGVVTRITPATADRPTIKVIYDASGNSLGSPFEIDLSQASGENIPAIIGPADPLSRNMDVGSFFAKEAS